MLIVFGAVGTLIIALYAFAALYPNPNVEWQQILFDSEGRLWVFGLPILVVFVGPLFSARRILREDRVRKGMSYSFSDSGIHIESSVAKADLQWAAIRHVIETRTAFLLLPYKNLAYTLPKECFGSDTAIAAVRELLRTHVAKAKLKNT